MLASKQAYRTQSHRYAKLSPCLGKDGQHILKVKQAGTDFGLHLVLDVRQYDYVAIGYRAGLRVLIHHHETPPLVSQLGFAVGPGTSTFAAINKQRVRL